MHSSDFGIRHPFYSLSLFQTPGRTPVITSRRPLLWLELSLLRSWIKTRILVSEEYGSYSLILLSFFALFVHSLFLVSLLSFFALFVHSLFFVPLLSFFTRSFVPFFSFFSRSLPCSFVPFLLFFSHFLPHSFVPFFSFLFSHFCPICLFPFLILVLCPICSTQKMWSVLTINLLNFE